MTSTDRPRPNPLGALFDADTNDYLGGATEEQSRASFADTTGTGIILIDQDGNPIAPGTWMPKTSLACVGPT